MARLRFGAPSFRECYTNNRKHRIASASTIGMWLSLSLAAFVGTAWPQDPAAGILPFSTQAVGIYDSVDLATSNINVTIPVRNKQGKIPFSYNLVGNSHPYIYACGSGCVPPQPAQWRGGFGLVGEVSVGANIGYTSTSKEVTCANLSVSALQLANFYITDSTGAIHPLVIGPVLLNTPEPCYGGGSGGGVTLGTTSDGSFYTLVEFPYTYESGGVTYNAATFTIYDKSGNAYEPGYNPLLNNSSGGIIIQDPDGAQISYTITAQSGSPLYTYTDTLGEQVITYTYNSTQSQSQYKDAGNNTQTFQVNMSSYTVQTNFGCSNVTDIAPTSESLDSSITLPIGTISFTYEVTPGDNHNPHYVTGRLASITYPTGGSVSYTYLGGNNNTGINCSNAVVPTLTKTVNDGHNNLSIWKYVNSDSVQGTYTVTVTDPATNVTVYTFSDPNNGSTGYQTEAQYYEGSATGTPLKTVITCYGNQNSTQSACLTSGTYGPIPTQVYTYLGTSTPSLVSTTYDTYGDITQVANYDYGAVYPPSSSTTLLSITTTAYDNPSTPCGTLSNAYIHNRPCSITTTNSSGTVGQTSYTYNSTGHAITTSQWVNNSKSLSSSATYATNGVLTSATDVNGAKTQYQNGPGVGACNGILPVGTTYPQIGSVQLSTSQIWDCIGAVVTSTTDANNAVTQTKYLVGSTADPLYRPLSVIDPLNNTTSFSYPTPTTFESAMNFNGSVSTSDTLITTDGLGRQMFAQTLQGQGKSTFDTVQTTYGWTTTGAVTSTSVPYSGNAGAAAPNGTGVTTTQYDAVGRPLSLSDSGGGSTTYQYFNQDTVVTVGPAPANEKLKIRQYEFNGLGWLTSVCEVTAGTTTYSGESCSPQIHSETGYLTKYLYSALGELQTVTQSANGSYAQGRSYKYDGLGRLTQEQNPESGTVNYTYDSVASGNCQGSYGGDLVMKVDNAGNVVCLQYDGLHRPTAISYPAGIYSSVTPSKTFLYDSTSKTCSDATGPNVAGRLAEAYTGTSSAKKVDTLYCYSPRGQTTDVYQSTPSSAGYAHLVLTYWANGQTDTINGIHQLSNIYYTLDGEGRTNGFDPTALTPDPVKTVSYNPASQITNINFKSGETDAYSYDVMDRMNNYTYVLGSSSLVGSPTWNANGTLGTLNITDQFNSANTQNCTYTHDDLVRISSVSCTGSGWGQAFTYDQFGNITKSGSSSWMPVYYASGATANRYVAGGTSYDANGNLLNDTFNTYSWDSDGNIVAVNGSTNSYDAFDKLVETSVGPTQFLYLPGGTQPFATMSNYESYLKVFAPAPGGTMILTPNGAEGVLSYHRHTDWIGSSRFATTPAETMYSDVAYAPFGEPYAPTGTTDLVFGGNAQDASVVEGATAGNGYDTLNRRYSAAQSRWISPDPSGLSAVDPTNPQSWNRYAYVLNNPLMAVDPLGLDCVYLNDSGDDVESIDHDSNAGECTGNGNGGYWVPGTVANSSWVTGIDQNNGTIGAYSNQNGFLGWTASANNDTGVAWQTVGVDVPTTEVDVTATYDQQAIQTIGNVLNTTFPTACTYSISGRVSVGGLGASVNSTQSGTSASVGPSATLSNFLRITVGLNTNGLGVADPSSTINIGPPGGGLAVNPINGQVGAYVGKTFNLFGFKTGATLKATVGKIGTNASCAAAAKHN